MTSRRAASSVSKAVGLACVVYCLFQLRTARAEHELVQALDLGAEHEVIDDWTLALGAQLRLDQGLSRVERVMPETELEYSPLKRLSFGAGYRLIYARSGSGELEIAHRLHLRSTVSVKWHDLRLAYRAKLQDRFEITRPGGTEHQATLRNAFKLRYTGWGFADPAASIEHFLALDSLGAEPTRRWRLLFSLEQQLGPSELSAFYRLDLPNASDEATTHMIGLGVYVQL